MTDWAEHILRAKAALKAAEEELNMGCVMFGRSSLQQVIDACEDAIEASRQRIGS